MIVLDTHVWVWWVHADSRLPVPHRELLDARVGEGLGVSVISCWEVAKLVEHGRLTLPYDVTRWVADALGSRGVRLLDLTPAIVIESTQLPQPFHKDPADQMIVATARLHQSPLATADGKILTYPHVDTLAMA